MSTDLQTGLPEHLKQCWDVLVVGTGMGGGTLGHALAQAGRSVLFCEVGRAVAGQALLRATYPELAGGGDGRVLGAADTERLRAAGRYAEVLHDHSTSRPRASVPFIGAGAGGSSALYGMAFERFLPMDFDPAEPPAAKDSASLARTWPVSYADMAPYYARAERLYRVRGETDAVALRQMGGAQPPDLLPPPEWSPAGTELAAFLRLRGLNPYVLPSACEYVDGCSTCQGFLCSRNCKNDAGNICLNPAVQQHGAAVLDHCRVLGVMSDGRRATGVHVLRKGQALRLQARQVVLAAGALQTPGILLASDSGPARAQAGLGNASGLVGRGLMRHLIDLYLVRPRVGSGEIFDNRRKELAFNDFYSHQGSKLGTVQSFGRLPPAAMLLGSLQDDLRATRWPRAAGLVSLAGPLLRPVLHDMAENWHTLASIAEDLPYADNGVSPGSAPGEVVLRYKLQAEAHARSALFRRLMADTLKGRRWRRLAQADNNQRIAHVCGTCRFGDDPSTSVLDQWNRVRGVDGLSVVDSSFFPSSGGTNPSLTIAANALRVAERIDAELG
jgi:choline dehydrogenase-like flavoprotein